MITIHETCSIGTKCFTATLLKRIQKKSCSYPFDWLFSNPDMIIDCISDDFECFLDKQQYTAGYHDKQSGHKKYGPIVFNHHNPIKDADYDYYKRCVVRFNTMLKTDCNKLFIWQTNNNRFVETFYQLVDTIMDKTKNVHFLIINNIHSDECTHSIIEKSNNLTTINFYHRSKDIGMYFEDDEDNDILYSLVKNMYNFELVDLHING